MASSIRMRFGYLLTFALTGVRVASQFLQGDRIRIGDLTCPLYCERCTKSTTCDKCQDGYFVQGTSGILNTQQCSPCTHGCSLCDDATVCRTCKSWAQKDQDGKCIEDEWHENATNIIVCAILILVVLAVCLAVCAMLVAAVADVSIHCCAWCSRCCSRCKQGCRRCIPARVVRTPRQNPPVRPEDEGVFQVGTKVKVHGLTSEAGQALNGQTGLITKITKLRYEVQIGLVTKSLKPENLKVISSS